MGRPWDGGPSTRSSNGEYRYGQTTVGVPLPDWATPLNVEVRVWQAVRDESFIFVSARRRAARGASLGRSVSYSTTASALTSGTATATCVSRSSYPMRGS